MAEQKATEQKKSNSNATVIAPPQKVYRWQDGNTVSGVLTAPITCVDEKFGKRTRIPLDTATVLLPSRYAAAYSGVPAKSKVTIVKSGQGRDTEYTLSYE